MDKAAVVVLNYNGRHWLQQFLPEIVRYSQPYPVVVVDNASQDGSVRFLTHYYPYVRCIQHGSNAGFAGGYNQALQQIEVTYYILLNNDVQVTPGWIVPLLELLDSDPTIAACQPKICSWKHKHVFDYAGAAGGFIDKLGYAFCRGRLFDTLETDRGQYNDVCEIFWASGACMGLRAEAFWKVGGFDGRLFAHYEEIDLCWRLQQRGYKVYYQGHTVVYHVGGATLQQGGITTTYLKFRNRALVLYKNSPVSTLQWRQGLRFCLDLVAALRACIQGKFKQAGAIVRAQLDFFRYKKYYKPISCAVLPKQMYQGLLPWDYFVGRKKEFGSLDPKKFTGIFPSAPSN